MKKNLPHEKLPVFLRDKKLKIASLVLGIILFSVIVVAFFANFWIGVTLFFLFIVISLLVICSEKYHS